MVIVLPASMLQLFGFPPRTMNVRLNGADVEPMLFVTRRSTVPSSSGAMKVTGAKVTYAVGPPSATTDETEPELVHS